MPLLLQQDCLPAGSMQSELLEAIFAHLPSIEDLACCKATSRAWQRAVPRARPLSIDMGDLRVGDSPAWPMWLGRHSDMLQHLRTVHIYNLEGSLDATLLTLWLSACHLKVVDLQEVSKPLKR